MNTPPSPFDHTLLEQLQAFAQRHAERYAALFEAPDTDPRALMAELRLLAAAMRTYQQQARHVQRAAPKRTQHTAEPSEPASATGDASTVAEAASQSESEALRQARWSADLARRTGFAHADRLAARVAELERDEQLQRAAAG